MFHAAKTREMVQGLVGPGPVAAAQALESAVPRKAEFGAMDVADRGLLRLVLLCAAATGLMALASSMA